MMEVHLSGVSSFAAGKINAAKFYYKVSSRHFPKLLRTCEKWSVRKIKENYILNLITEVEWKTIDAEQDEGPEVLKKPVDEEARVGIKGEEKEND